jgi:predicted nuclease of predicted toxin-antitoxin system
MKFVVDAHLPRRLALFLQQAGFDALHMFDLTQGNRTPDSWINQLSLNEQRIVITKDADFVDSFWLRQEPWKLLLVATGNIRNAELIALFQANLEQITEGFDIFDFIEISRTNVIFHA